MSQEAKSHEQRDDAGKGEKEQFRPVVSHLDGQRRLKAAFPDGVDARQKGEGLGSQQQRNADVNTRAIS